MKNSRLLFLSVLLLSLSFSGRFAAQGAEVSIRDGIFTTDQAARGAEVFNASCSSCHGADLQGNSNAASLRGMSFMFLWEGRSVGELFETIRTQMPAENPNSLPASSYLDALTYILQANNFPAGSTELVADQQRLESILITPPQ